VEITVRPTRKEHGHSRSYPPEHKDEPQIVVITTENHNTKLRQLGILSAHAMSWRRFECASSAHFGYGVILKLVAGLIEGLPAYFLIGGRSVADSLHLLIHYVLVGFYEAISREVAHPEKPGVGRTWLMQTMQATTILVFVAPARLRMAKWERLYNGGLPRTFDERLY